MFSSLPHRCRVFVFIRRSLSSSCNNASMWPPRSARARACVCTDVLQAQSQAGGISASSEASGPRRLSKNRPGQKQFTHSEPTRSTALKTPLSAPRFQRFQIHSCGSSMPQLQEDGPPTRNGQPGMKIDAPQKQVCGRSAVNLPPTPRADGDGEEGWMEEEDGHPLHQNWLEKRQARSRPGEEQHPGPSRAKERK